MEEKNNNTAKSIDFREWLYDYIKAAKHYWWVLILSCTVFALLSQFGSNIMSKQEYTASCTVTVKVVSNSVTEEFNSNYNIYYDKDLAQQLEKTFTYILNSDYLSDDVEPKLGNISLSKHVKSVYIKGSNMFEIHAVADSSEKALNILAAVVDAFPNAARYVVGDLKMDMVEELSVREGQYNDGDWKRTLLGGLVSGFLVGSALLVIYILTHKTVRNPKDLEEKLNMPCLGVIPRADLHSAEIRESVRGIASKIEATIEKDKNQVILVTSTLPREGKSSVSRMLAETLAGWGVSVCLLDCDLRKPSLWRSYGIKNKELPLEAHLRNEVPLEDLIYDVGIENLCFVGNSLFVEHPTELLDSPAMKEMITNLSKAHDLLIIDAPPCDILSDVTVLQRYADQILYVVRQEYVSIAKIENTVESLCNQDEKFLGYVMNFAVQSITGYGKYGYGKYSYGKYGNGYYGKYGKYGSKYYYTKNDEDSSKR